jgi:ubiquinone/menaquinone biosynthesis C-methylase UbiE
LSAASPYDAAAPSFDRHRALPQGVPEKIRGAILGALGATRPRLLDLGAGTGRIGRPFVVAGDDYIAVDLSLGMLREFARQSRQAIPTPRLVQADGERLPFRDAAFDAVLLVQIIGAAQSWRTLVTEARRALRPAGALILGHAVAPAAGIDAQMKQRLAQLLAELGVPAYHMETRGVAQPWLEAQAQTSTRITAVEWTAPRTPGGFLARQQTGARFSRLPEAVRAAALRQLAEWAGATFGSLDIAFEEPHAFELQVFKF